MKAEAETPNRVVRAKALNATDDTNPDNKITSIQKQLVNMTEILKMLISEEGTKRRKAVPKLR